MFQYATVKTIAETKGYEFRYIRHKNTGFINSTDSKYGNEINTIFSLPPEEQLFSIPDFPTYHEVPHQKRNNPQSVYQDVKDNMIVRGFFITPILIEHNLNNVRKWFSLPRSVIEKASQFIQPYKASGKKICIVHFRVGNDYLLLGYKLSKSYWKRAAAEVLKAYPDVQFVLVYDKLTRDVSSFMKSYPDAVQFHGSLVDDMAMLTLGDINIVSNSSFSIMGALLNSQSIMTLCPSVYPSPFGNLPDNTYGTAWIRIPARRDILSSIACNLRNAAKKLLPVSLIRKYLKN